ncbi:hypothetical protein M2146_001093 [Lachnospiraceae bacterium PF1-22]
MSGLKEKKEKIMKWLPGYIEETFVKSNENVWGHMHNHINQTDEKLIRRSLRDKVNASSFTISYDELTDLIRSTMLEYIDVICYWLAKEEDVPLDLYYEGSSIIGKSFSRSKKHEWKEGAQQCSDAIIVLKKRKKSNEFYVVTAYLEPFED